MDRIQKEYANISSEIQYAFSYGLIYCNQDQNEINVDELLKEADYVMYQQKREHRKDSH